MNSEITKLESPESVNSVPPKAEDIFLIERVTEADMKKLNKEERKRFDDMYMERQTHLQGKERYQLIEQFYETLTDETKSQVWEHNHNQIMATMSNLIQMLNRMPTVTEIADETQLSRTTVHKHLKEYRTDPNYKEQKEQYKFLGDRLLAKVYQYATTGNLKAARLYFEVTGTLNETRTKITTQNNYIQINGLVIDEKQLAKLPPERVSEIENLIKTALRECEALPVAHVQI